MEPSLRNVYDTLLEIRFLLERSQNELVKRVSVDEKAILLKLNESQIKTYLLMESEKDYTAEDIAAMTGNARAHESSVLNQLTRLNLVDKRRRSKTVYFRKTSRNYEEHLHKPTLSNIQGRSD